MIVYPKYYEKFKCSAGNCKHTCCVGWEIDIDDNTLCRYRKLTGELGRKLDKNIETKDGCTCFKLDKNERCPFLLENGLCEIITELGEYALCDICSEHPRFRNFYENFEEIGLGMCCEEAAKIILSEKEPFCLNCEQKIVLTAEECALINFRNSIFSEIQNRDVKMEKRISNLEAKFCKNVLLPEKIIKTYIALERLDEKWTEAISHITPVDFSKKAIRNFPIPFEQLMCYFVFRHLKNAFEAGYPEGCVAMAISACLLLDALCVHYFNENGEMTIEVLSDFTRMYSAEVEYSEENTYTLFEAFS